MSKAKTEKIRVLYLVNRLPRHGPIFQLHNIIKYVDREKFYPQLVTLSPEAVDSHLPAFGRLGIDHHCLGLSRMASLVFGAMRLRKFLKKCPVDLIHTSDYRSTLVCSKGIAGLPRVITCRQAFDYRHYSLDRTMGPVFARAFVRTYQTACEKCERVVGVSDFVRHSAKKELVARMDVIHNGVDRDLFGTIDKKEAMALRSKLDLPKDKKVILTSGLSKRKDPVTIIKAFLDNTVNRSSALVLLGKGALRQECLSLAAGKENIRIVGFVENVKDYLHSADFFVSASITEGCPNAVMEAMACGLPVILSDIPPHREILDYDRRAGLLFSIQNPDSLSNALSKALDIDYTEQTSAALKIIANHLNAEVMSSKYQDLYTQLKRIRNETTRPA